MLINTYIFVASPFCYIPKPDDGECVLGPNQRDRLIKQFAQHIHPVDGWHNFLEQVNSTVLARTKPFVGKYALGRDNIDGELVIRYETATHYASGMNEIFAFEPKLRKSDVGPWRDRIFFKLTADGIDARAILGRDYFWLGKPN